MTTLASIPFYTDNIQIGYVISASDPYYFQLQGSQLRDFIRENRCNLSEYDDKPDHLLATLDTGDFIEFYEKRI